MYTLFAMVDFTQIFASKARIKTLRTLYYQESPLPLRHVAVLSQMPLFSVQRVLNQMVAEKMVSQKKQKNYRLFSLNRKHQSYPFLAGLFELEMKNQIPARHDKKAHNLLDFIMNAQELIMEAKGI